MHCLAACEEAERIIKKAKYFPSSVPAHQHLTRIGRETNIRELYEAECARDLKTGQLHLRSGSMLLEKLVTRDRLHTLIINLHAEKGYSISLRTFVSTDDNFIDSNPSTSGIQGKMLKEIAMEGEFIMYKTDRLLRYIDNEELPYFLALMLESNYSYMFYSGCLIAEIRDFRQTHSDVCDRQMFSDVCDRQTYSDVCDTHYVLLKPSTQTFHYDVNHLATKYDLNEHDRQQLESKLLAKTVPLCLDPSPANAIVANKIQHERQLLNTPKLRRTAFSYSQVATNRKRKLTNSARSNCELLDVINRHRVKTRNNKSNILFEPSTHFIANTNIYHPPKLPAPVLDIPPMRHPVGDIPVAALAQKVKPKLLTSDANLTPLDKFEKKIKDRDPEQKRVNHIKLTLFQRKCNLEYVGELYLDSDYQEGLSKGSACQFSLGPSRRHAYCYKNQFWEIFNEASRADAQQENEQLTTPIATSNVVDNRTSNNDGSVSIQNICHQSNAPSTSGSQGIITHLSNGSAHCSAGSVVLLPGSQGVISASTSQINSTNVPILQSQLQSNINQNRPQLRQIPITIPHAGEIQHCQLAFNNKSTITNTTNNATIRSRLNSAPVNHQNSAESAAVAKAIINNSNIAIVSLTQHRTIAPALNQKVATDTRNLVTNQQRGLVQTNRDGQIITNNCSNTLNSLQQPVQINLSQLAASASVNQGHTQTFNITSLNNIGFTAVPLNSVNTQQKTLNNRLIAPSATSPSPKRTLSSSPGTAAINSGDSRLHALLQGTAAADHHVEGANSDSGLLERIRASSGTSPVPSASPTSSPKSVMHLVATQSPKSRNNPTGNTQLSSPPPQVVGQQQSINLAQLANFTGQQSDFVHLQIPVIPQSIQLPITSVSHTGVLLPISTTGATSNDHIVSSNVTSSVASANATVLPITILTQNVNKGNVRGTTSQQLQVVSTLQRPRSTGSAHSATRALLANTPIRIASPNANVSSIQTMNAANVTGNSIVTLSGQPQQIQLALQKQAQLQRINQQQKSNNITSAAVAAKFRRRSNAADPNK